MNEAELRQIIDEGRFTGKEGEKKAMKLVKCYERVLLRNGVTNGIIPQSEIKGNRFSYNRNRTAIFKMGSCPNGYHILFVCRNCRIIVRNDAISCPRCHKVRFIKKCGSKYCKANKQFEEGTDLTNPLLPAGSCGHVTRVIDHDQPHAFFYDIVGHATDTYMHMEDDLVNVSRQDLVGSSRYDKENDCFSSDTSFNSVAIATRLNEKEIQQEAIKSYARMPPADERCFLKPDFEKSFDKKLIDIGM